MTTLKLISSALFITFGSLGAAYAATLDKDDTVFLERATQASHFQVMAGDLALKQSTNAEVQTFAAQMMADHKQVQGELAKLAQTKGQVASQALGKAQQEELAELATRVGQDFDQRYADEVATDANKDATKIYAKSSKDAQDIDIKSFAARMLPVVQQHLELGRTLEKAVKLAK